MAPEVALQADGSVHMHLQPGQKLYLCGYGKFRVLAGTIGCFGTTLSASQQQSQDRWHEFYSPDAYALLYMENLTVDIPAVVHWQLGDPYWSQLAEFFSFKSLWGESLQTTFNPAVVHPQSLVEPESSMDNPTSCVTPIFAKKLAIVPESLTSANGSFPFLLPRLWEELHVYLLSQCATAPSKRLLIVGDRGCGKSTFCRFVTNGLLNMHQRVIFVDLDPGQTEFSFPACLSVSVVDRPIFGPPFTHVCQSPEFMYFLGNTSPGDNPVEFLQALGKLETFLRTALPALGNHPVVINTMGWITGLGEEFLHGVIHAMRPDFIIPIIDSDFLPDIQSCPDVLQARQFIEHLIYSKVGQFYPNYCMSSDERPSYLPQILPLTARRSVNQSSSKYHNKDLRFLVSSAYFTRDKAFFPLKYRTGQDMPLDAIKFLYSGNRMSNRNAICPSDERIFRNELSRTEYSVVGLYDHSMTVLGLAYIQSIDFARRLINLVTPLCPLALKRVHAIRTARFELMTSLELSGDYLATLKPAANTVGALPSRVRYDLPRRRPFSSNNN